MNIYQIKSLLFGTNSIFHNPGLSIYRYSPKRIQVHQLNMKDNSPALEQVRLTSIEDYLKTVDHPNTVEKIEALLIDAEETISRFADSAARAGILFCHSSMPDAMKMHIHRQAYSIDPGACISVHYRLTGNGPNYFAYGPSISQAEIIANDLCDNQKIQDWMADKPIQRLSLLQPKNIILFDSALVPHAAVQSDDFQAYVIFDHLKLKTGFRLLSEPVLLNDV